MFTATSQLTPGLSHVAWSRDSAGNPVKLYRDVASDGTYKLTNDRPHLRMVRDEREVGGRRGRVPLHSAIRDVKSRDAMTLMRTEIPEAHDIVANFSRVAAGSREDALRAEERYVDALTAWRNDYLRQNRSDGDSLFLQLETVASLGKMIEITYATPTIEDAFPISVLGTVLTSARGLEKELVEELPVFGVDVSISGLPTASIRRGERWYNLVHVKAGAVILDTEIARWKEIVGNYPEDFGFDLWEERLRGAALAVQRGVARTIAFGRPQNQIQGLFRGNQGIPTEAVEFTAATPADNLAAVSNFIAAQFASVNGRLDMQADSLAMSPFAFMALSQQLFNSANASNMFTMEMIMRANPQIKNIYQILEAQPNPDDAAALVEHGMDATEAAINSGGIRIAGTQRNAIVAYRRDPKFVEIIKGFDLETTIYPQSVDTTLAKVVESTGGLIVHQPRTMRIGYEPN